MKQKTLLIMTLLSMLFGCDNKLSGPDFEHQENKVIVLDEHFRIDYQVPGNLSQLMNFESEYKKHPKSINIDNIRDLNFKKEYWRDSISLDNITWEYYRGKRNKEANSAADFSIDIDIHKSATNEFSILSNILKQNYEDFLNGDNGINTNIRKKFHELNDNELGQWITPMPSFNILKINNVSFINWKTYGEVKGWNIDYFITPIDNKHYLAIYFSYNFSTKNSKELDKLETMLKNDINKFMNQIEVSKL